METEININKDGNCQFSAIGYHLKQDSSIIRSNIVKHIELFKNDYIEFLDDTVDFEEYIEIIKQDGVWGDNLTLQAASQIFNINILVNENIKILYDSNKQIDLYLKYIDNHYNVIIKNKEVSPFTKEENIKTIFDDPVNFNYKHPLNYKWSFWIDKKVKSDNWLDTIQNLITIDSIEDFWSLFNNIPKASSLNYPSDYYLFKHNIQPMWEDPKNKDGGKMTIIIRKNDNDFLDNVWLNSVLGIIGEQFDSDLISGLVLNIRKHQDRINIWTETSDQEILLQIGHKWKELTDIQKLKMNASFIKHSDTTVNYII